MAAFVKTCCHNMNTINACARSFWQNFCAERVHWYKYKWRPSTHYFFFIFYYFIYFARSFWRNLEMCLVESTLRVFIYSCEKKYLKNVPEKPWNKVQNRRAIKHTTVPEPGSRVDISFYDSWRHADLASLCVCSSCQHDCYGWWDRIVKRCPTSYPGSFHWRSDDVKDPGYGWSRATR